MTMERDDLTPGEIGRSLRRIEDTLGDMRAEMKTDRATLGEHDTAIQLLQSSKNTAVWLIGGAWGLLLIIAEWALHRVKP